MKNIKNMMDTQSLIASMSQEVASHKNQKPKLQKPKYFIIQSLVILLMYMLSVQFFLGVREDLLLKLQEPAFALEIFLLLALLITSVISAIFNMYPDVYQQAKSTRWPYGFGLMFFALIAFEWMIQNISPRTPNPIIAFHFPDLIESTHTVECLICIAASACLPFFILWALLKKGATVHGKRLGLLLAFAAFSLGCLSLRLAEVTNDMTHLITWHYLPMLVIALISAALGRWLFRW